MAVSRDLEKAPEISALLTMVTVAFEKWSPECSGYKNSCFAQ